MRLLNVNIHVDIHFFQFNLPGTPSPAGLFLILAVWSSSRLTLLLVNAGAYSPGNFPSRSSFVDMATEHEYEPIGGSQIGAPRSTFCTVRPEVPAASIHFSYAAFASKDALDIGGIG